MARIYHSAEELIGNTPLLHLKRVEENFGLKAHLFAKLEYLNPAGSVKDRERVVHAWLETPEKIIGAAHNGKRGNPCLFPRDYYPELMALQEDHGGNQVIRAHPEELRTVEIPKVELTDVDTPVALEELEKQLII